jgi:peptide deformylase
MSNSIGSLRGGFSVARSVRQNSHMEIPELLTIVECGDPILRRHAEPLDPAELASVEIVRLIHRMRATMEEAPGVGLAAPQIGESIQLAVLADDPSRLANISEDQIALRERRELPFTVLVNPVLTPIEDLGSRSFYEGCLSVPGLIGVVARHRSVRVEGLDEQGKSVSHIFTGWPARIAQHEIDHLNGVLYLDRVETRSLSTVENYATKWAGHSPMKAANALGFALDRDAPVNQP